MLRRSFLQGTSASLVPFAMPVWAQEPLWPGRPIRMVVGFPPGGTADILARKLQTPLAVRLGQPIIIENRTGAGGMTAALEVARSVADGYTLELCVSTHASLPAINKTMPYDTERDFAPIVFVGSIPLVLIVNQRSSFKILADLLAAAKAKLGSLNYAFPGDCRTAVYSAATCAEDLRMGLSSQASSQLSTLSDLTNLPTPSTSAQNRPSSIISSSVKCLARSA